MELKYFVCKLDFYMLLSGENFKLSWKVCGCCFIYIKVLVWNDLKCLFIFFYLLGYVCWLLVKWEVKIVMVMIDIISIVKSVWLCLWRKNIMWIYFECNEGFIRLVYVWRV